MECHLAVRDPGHRGQGRHVPDDLDRVLASLDVLDARRIFFYVRSGSFVSFGIMFEQRAKTIQLISVWTQARLLLKWRPGSA